MFCERACFLAFSLYKMIIQKLNKMIEQIGHDDKNEDELYLINQYFCGNSCYAVCQSRTVPVENF